MVVVLPAAIFVSSSTPAGSPPFSRSTAPHWLERMNLGGIPLLIMFILSAPSSTCSSPAVLPSGSSWPPFSFPCSPSWASRGPHPGGVSNRRLFVQHHLPLSYYVPVIIGFWTVPVRPGHKGRHRYVISLENALYHRLPHLLYRTAHCVVSAGHTSWPGASLCCSRKDTTWDPGLSGVLFLTLRFGGFPGNDISLSVRTP